MESESDFDGVSPSCLTASAPALARSNDITTIHNRDTDLCSPQLFVDFFGGFSSGDDSVTESDSDDGLPEATVGDYLKADPADAFVLDAKHHIRVPPSLSKHLRSYQREDVQFLFRRYVLGPASYSAMTWASERRFRLSPSSLRSCVKLARRRTESAGGTAFRNSKMAESGATAASCSRQMTNGLPR